MENLYPSAIRRLRAKLNISQTELLTQTPKQGYLTISNALQWRLQYARVISLQNAVDGVINYEFAE